MTGPEPDLCAATEFLDHRSPAVREFLAQAVRDHARPQRALAVELYYAVRDGIPYEIYGADLSRRGMRASGVLARGRGLCIHKSTLYAACARALGIPSRLVFVDVRNHVASERLKRLLGGDVVRYHAMASVRLDGRWVKATPVFDARLCGLYRIAPLDFDGETDSVLQPSDESGRSSLEVVHEHGQFDDLPYETLLAGMRRAHPALFDGPTTLRAGSLAAETTPAAGG
jgi:transglutaminase-like putative cysteine protease